MRAIPLAVMGLAAMVLAAACNTRFDADFESDAPGSPPPLNPPGPPAGDEILVIDSNTDGDGVVIRITDEPALVSPGAPHRFMSLEREENPGLTSVALLRTSSFATSTQSIYVSWVQVLDGGGSGNVSVAPLTGRLQTEASNCRIFTINDQILADCFAQGQGPVVEGQLTGLDTQSQHTLLLRIDRSSTTVVLQGFQDGEATDVLELSHPDFKWSEEGERMAVQITYDGQSDGAYRINSLTVSERDPN